ncbi:hypothetical protein QNE68_003933, partial [Vibrio fluvialis]|nr:hypothetical protein [Vibrio fluvialis]
WFKFPSRASFLESYLNYYRSLPNLKSAIIDGCSAKFKILYDGQEYELKHTHQEEFEDENGNVRGVNNSVLLNMAVNLAVKEQSLSEAKSFDEVYEIVESCRVAGFGELSIYDAAVRISAYLGFKPTQVFLHAGTRIGARYLEEKGLLDEDLSQNDTLPLSDFPQPIQKLDALQLENFLCSFKDEINNI